MITGEGLVFFLILSLGLWRIRSAIKKDQQLSERQSNFLLSVTHELKTPLASTKLYLQTLLKRDFVFEKRNELLQKALLENQRLEEIVDAILTASRLENQTIKAHKEWINLNELLTDLADKYNTRLGKNWIIVELSDKISIESDLFMVKTILINLIENALKYAGTDQNLTLFLYRDKQNSKFGTKDAGPGISTEVQPDIFKKFVRLENEETRSQKGTGLGLFIASEFCKLIGGKLKYIDNQPKGAIFEITL
jgi:K+-sensing histidine kinase KdpD